MKIQKSFSQDHGVLYVVGTPIGNLGDLSIRAREILHQVDVVAAEDTRHTRKLLTHFEISKPLTSYHQHNQNKKGDQLIERLIRGESIALVSDAGMPSISDPGEQLIKHAIEEGIPVVPIPGPNAALAALVGSGLPAQPFVFIGFLPRVTKKRKEELARWSKVMATLLFYESPFRLVEMLQDVLSVFGDRQVVISREITKKNEEWIRGTLEECVAHLQTVEVKGECTVVVSGCTEEIEKRIWSEEEIIVAVGLYIQDGFTKKEAIQKVAVEHDLSKNGVYETYHAYLNKNHDRI